MSDGGKGDMPRPFSVPLEVFESNFEAIFGKKTTKPQPQIEPIVLEVEENDDAK